MNRIIQAIGYSYCQNWHGGATSIENVWGRIVVLRVIENPKTIHRVYDARIDHSILIVALYSVGQ